MNAAAEAEFNILLATDSYKVKAQGGRGCVGDQREAAGRGRPGWGRGAGEVPREGAAAGGMGQVRLEPQLGRRLMEQGWRDGRQEAGPGGVRGGAVRRGVEAGPNRFPALAARGSGQLSGPTAGASLGELTPSPGVRPFGPGPVRAGLG